ncbi:hypothetical protein ACST14_07360 [Aquirufa sp. A-Brett2-15D]
MKKLVKTSFLLAIIGTFCFSCGNESKTDTTKSDSLVKAADTVQIAAPSPEQLLEEQKQVLLKYSNAKMNDVGDWVKQFEELRSNTINNNEDGTKSPEEAMATTNTVYKNGVQYKVTSGYEYQSFELFIPHLKANEAKRLVNRLCKNMGGCLGPDEVEVKYSETKDGVKVEWGGGC